LFLAFVITPWKLVLIQTLYQYFSIVTQTILNLATGGFDDNGKSYHFELHRPGIRSFGQTDGFLDRTEAV